MNYKRALITGGAGLIGSHIADRLVTEGYQEIVVLDNFTQGGGRISNPPPLPAN